jgi:uncharacterized damage-inducible protein DinB
MDVAGLLAELFGRVDDEIEGAIGGLSPEQLATPPEPGANTIGWLVWHLTRVEDSHIAELIDGADELWSSGPWAASFGLEPDPRNSGYGHTADDVLTVRPASGDALRDYYRAVRERTSAYLATVTPDDLDRVVDRRWDPPVTLGVRLVSIADDEIQHAGQAAYARGLLDRR